MNAPPEPVWSALWCGVDLRVFTTGGDSRLLLDAAASVLSGDEQERAARFHFQNDRERWMRSRALLRLVLGERLGLNAQALEFKTGTYGKPSLNRQGDRMSPLHFNLSHSGEYAAVAVSEQPVGVDIESWNPGLDVHEIAGFSFHSDEAEAVRHSSEPERLFRQLWTAKEAVMKCHGQGMQIAPRSVRLEFREGFPAAAERMDFDPEDFPDWTKHFQLTSHEMPGQWTLAAALPA